eukprot:GHVL01025536.1.p1 GENE.GHVL01025536.1~~GHVL01025536.1.p1  ORF type:complete len:637 (-),score=142.68 GHVL01025536.1:955-2865(-)
MPSGRRPPAPEDNRLFLRDKVPFFRDDHIRLWAGETEPEDAPRPWLAKIVNYDSQTEQMEVQWYYWPDEAIDMFGDLGRELETFGKAELVNTFMTDWNPISAIRNKVIILRYQDYIRTPLFRAKTYYWRQMLLKNDDVLSLTPELNLEISDSKGSKTVRNPDFIYAQCGSCGKIYVHNDDLIREGPSQMDIFTTCDDCDNIGFHPLLPNDEYIPPPPVTPIIDNIGENKKRSPGPDPPRGTKSLKTPSNNSTMSRNRATSSNSIKPKTPPLVDQKPKQPITKTLSTTQHSPLAISKQKPKVRVPIMRLGFKARPASPGGAQSTVAIRPISIDKAALSSKAQTLKKTEMFRLSKMDPKRQGVVKQIQERLTKGLDEMKNSDLSVADVIKLSLDIEEDLNFYYGTLTNEYVTQLRMILSNLGHKDNAQLRRKILTGEIKSEQLPTISSKQIAPPGVAQHYEEIRSKALKDSILDESESQRFIRKSKRGLEEVDANEGNETAEDDSTPTGNSLVEGGGGVGGKDKAEDTAAPNSCPLEGDLSLIRGIADGLSPSNVSEAIKAVNDDDYDLFDSDDEKKSSLVTSSGEKSEGEGDILGAIQKLLRIQCKDEEETNVILSKLSKDAFNIVEAEASLLIVRK